MPQQNEFIITPEMDPERAALLKKHSETLDWILEGQKPAGQNGILEQIGSMLWDSAGLDPDQLRDAIEDARDEEEMIRVIITGGIMKPR
jgi:hypothetical protein